MDQFYKGLAILQASTGTGNPTMQMLSTLVTFGLVFVIFYFLIIRPQNKKQKEAQKMIEAIKKGDRVVTAGGVHATVYTVKEKTVILKVDDDTKIEFSKSAVTAVEAKSAEEKIEAPADKSADKAVEDKK